MSFHRITISQVFRNRIFQNVFHLFNPGGLETPEQIALRIETEWIPHFRGCQFSSMVYNQIEVRTIDVTNPPAAFVKAINIAGTGSLTAALGIMAWKLQFRTTLAGRKHRGRYFIAGIANGFIDLSTERLGVGTPTTFMNGLVANLNSRWTGANPTQVLNLVVAHKDGSQPTFVDRIEYETLPSALRSRRPGIGI